MDLYLLYQSGYPPPKVVGIHGTIQRRFIAQRIKPVNLDLGMYYTELKGSAAIQRTS